MMTNAELDSAILSTAACKKDIHSLHTLACIVGAADDPQDIHRIWTKVYGLAKMDMALARALIYHPQKGWRPK